jgi:hypothetical protein
VRTEAEIVDMKGERVFMKRGTGGRVFVESIGIEEIKAIESGQLGMWDIGEPMGNQFRTKGKSGDGIWNIGKLE